MAGNGKGKGKDPKKIKEQTPKVQKSTKKEVKRRATRHETFSIYNYKVLKHIHNDIGISKKAMKVLNSFINDMFDKLTSEAAKLARINGKQTLSAREIQSTVRLLLPGELAKHGIVEGCKALSKTCSK